MTRNSTRRDFLRGKPAQDALADAVDRAAPKGGSPDASRSTAEEPYVLRVSREAMACQFEVQFNVGQYEHGTELALETLDLVDRLEGQLSIFRKGSEICHINRTAAGRPVEVEPRLFALLETVVSNWLTPRPGAESAPSLSPVGEGARA